MTRESCSLAFFSPGAPPSPPQPVSNRQQGWPDEHADKTKHQRATQHTEENQDERQVAALADEPGFNHVVPAADDHAPPEQESPPAGFALIEKPESGGKPDQRRTHWHDRQKK